MGNRAPRSILDNMPGAHYAIGPKIRALRQKKKLGLVELGVPPREPLSDLIFAVWLKCHPLWFLSCPIFNFPKSNPRAPI